MLRDWVELLFVEIPPDWVSIRKIPEVMGGNPNFASFDTLQLIETGSKCTILHYFYAKYDLWEIPSVQQSFKSLTWSQWIHLPLSQRLRPFVFLLSLRHHNIHRNTQTKLSFPFFLFNFCCSFPQEKWKQLVVPSIRIEPIASSYFTKSAAHKFTGRKSPKKCERSLICTFPANKLCGWKKKYYRSVFLTNARSLFPV